MSPEKKAEISLAWEDQFTKLFKLLGLKDTTQYIKQTIKPVAVKPNIKFYLGESVQRKTFRTWPTSRCPLPIRVLIGSIHFIPRTLLFLRRGGCLLLIKGASHKRFVGNRL